MEDTNLPDSISFNFCFVFTIVVYLSFVGHMSVAITCGVDILYSGKRE